MSRMHRCISARLVQGSQDSLSNPHQRKERNIEDAVVFAVTLLSNHDSKGCIVFRLFDEVSNVSRIRVVNLPLVLHFNRNSLQANRDDKINFRVRAGGR